MRKTIKTIVGGLAASAAVPALGLAMATSASAAQDTPDDYWEGVPGGWVMWNDYDSEWHDKDLDNIWVEDFAGDGDSVRLTVYWGGETHTTHAYYGEVAKISVGNVPNGRAIGWEACEWDDGVEYDCEGGVFFE